MTKIYYDIGMTGTRNGMNERQKILFNRLLKHFKIDKDQWFHHGDCIGADAEGHNFAYELGYHIFVHPPIKNEVRAFKTNAVKYLPPKSYFARNRDIVDASEVLLATPATDFETQGGTWYTINYAKKKNKPIYIIYPEKDVEVINI